MTALTNSEMDQRNPAAGGKKAKVTDVTEVTRWQEPGLAVRDWVPVLALAHRSCVALDKSCTSLHLGPLQSRIFFFSMAVLGIEPSTRCLLSMCSTTELYPSPPQTSVLILGLVSIHDS